MNFPDIHKDTAPDWYYRVKGYDQLGEPHELPNHFLCRCIGTAGYPAYITHALGRAIAWRSGLDDNTGLYLVDFGGGWIYWIMNCHLINEE